jgi:hypothetical protein
MMNLEQNMGSKGGPISFMNCHVSLKNLVAPVPFPQTSYSSHSKSKRQTNPDFCCKKGVALTLLALVAFGCHSSNDGTAGSSSEHPASCSDEIKNGDEEGVDCGGSCPTCVGSTPTGSPIKEYFARFRMPIERNGCTTLHRPHSVRRWSVFYTGRCAACGIPSRISSAAFGNTLIVSWVGSATYGGSSEPNKRRFGHLSTFTFTEEGGFKKTNDFVYDECDYDMGSVTVSPDGSVIGALCISDRPDHAYQNNVILYEWTGGQITQTPELKKVIVSSAGGWSYGHWDLSLNNKLSHYYVTAKTVTDDGAHEGMTRFALNRQSHEEEHPGSCGGGHPTSNRIVHNKHDDTWSVFCRMDANSINWVFAGTPGDGGSNATIGSYAYSTLSDTPGGLHNAISLGSDGWLVAATGPFDLWKGLGGATATTLKAKLVDQQIGLRRLPRTMKELQGNEAKYPWNWIDVDDVCAPTKGGERLAGIVQLHNWGLGGEDSGRILMGYAPTRGHTAAGEFHVVEVDKNGLSLHDPVLLKRGGWGIDTLGTYMPGSGCVVFPYTWVPDAPENGPGSGYPAIEEAVTGRSEFLKFTAICPSGSPLRKSPGKCQTQPSTFSEATPSSPPSYQSECPTF